MLPRMKTEKEKGKNTQTEIIYINTDILVIGGGAAGCYAAITAKEINPDIDVLVIEKAHIKRSGCLAAGVNAINAYLNPGETPESFLQYVKKDSAGLVRDDLVLTIGEGVNRVTERLDEWGVPFPKDESGAYIPRGKRNIEVTGEAIKPVLASALEASGAGVLNRTVAVDYIVSKGKVVGAYAFSARENKFYVISAKAAICATGGAAGLYRPNNEGSSRHKMWYSPFNVGTGFAMGLRAGAEMTTFEMRFIALRVKDVISPTGTIAQGVSAKQVNALGEAYQKNYSDASTPMRLQALIEENKAGRGPCYLDFTQIPDTENNRLTEAYLNMSPGLVLKWADEQVKPNQKPVEVCGSEPYIVGGHGQAGYWVDVHRKSNMPGLFAAGDVAGGAPKKYVTGCFVEGEIAAKAALDYVKDVCLPELDEAEVLKVVEKTFKPLSREEGSLPDAFEERLQKIMDEYAGGISTDYQLSEPMLLKARQLLQLLAKDVQEGIAAEDMHQLVKAHEVLDRVLVARVLVEHLLYRRETRWRAYHERVDYPQRDDNRWMVFVNSLYSAASGEIKILEHDPVTVTDYTALWKGESP